MLSDVGMKDFPLYGRGGGGDDKNLGKSFTRGHERKCLDSIFLLVNVFSSNLKTINFENFQHSTKLLQRDKGSTLNPPPRKMGGQFYRALENLRFSHNCWVGLSQRRGLKFCFFFFFLEDKRQSLLKFVGLFQIKFNFSIENIFLRV